MGRVVHQGAATGQGQEQGVLEEEQPEGGEVEEGREDGGRVLGLPSPHVCVYASGLAIIDVEELLEDMDAVGRGMVAANGRETQEGGERERERVASCMEGGGWGRRREGGREGKKKGNMPMRMCVEFVPFRQMEGGREEE